MMVALHAGVMVTLAEARGIRRDQQIHVCVLWQLLSSIGSSCILVTGLGYCLPRLCGSFCSKWVRGCHLAFQLLPLAESVGLLQSCTECQLTNRQAVGPCMAYREDFSGACAMLRRNPFVHC